MKSEVGKDGGFLRGVVTLNVESRVGLEVAEFGCLGHCLFERNPGRIHAVKNVVGRTVHDAHDALHLVASE